MKDKIYMNSPYFIKVFLLNIIAYKNLRKRNTLGYKKYLEKYLSYWLLSNDELYKIQENELRNLMEEAFLFVPFYQKAFSELKVSLDEIKSAPYEVLKKMPLLTKEDRKIFSKDIANNNPNRPLLEIVYTSGTSGTPTENFLDQESFDKSFAFWSRFHTLIGVSKKAKSVRFSGRLVVNPKQNRKPFWVYNYFEKQLLMSSYHLKDENMQSYIDKLNKFKPEFLDGYPSTFYIIANYVIKNELTLNFKPIAIATTAETLHDHHRDVIEKVFMCPVYNQYASSEGSPFITECKERKMHVNIDSGIFEFFNDKNEVAKEGEIARMVVTSFRNLKTPLIRYDILDSVLVGNENTKCRCGSEMPLIEKIIGREDDLLWTPEKGYIGRMDTAYKGLTGISQSQIIQISPNEFLVKNIIDSEYTKEIEKKFIKNLKDRLGENILLNFEYVNFIPLSKNGKFEAVKRNFKLK